MEMRDIQVLDEQREPRFPDAVWEQRGTRGHSFQGSHQPAWKSRTPSYIPPLSSLDTRRNTISRTMSRRDSIDDEIANPSLTSLSDPHSPGHSTCSEKALGKFDTTKGYEYHYDSVGFLMTVLGCSFALAGSQIVGLLYLTLGTRISEDLNRPELTIWLLSAGIIAMGSLSPFVGPLADLFGRKPIFLSGVFCGIVGSIVCALTPTAPGFIAGQILLGFGAVVEELMAITVVSEIVPSSKRGLYAALILAAIIPWSPGTLYADYMASYSWRWIGLPLGIWHLLIFLIIGCFYFPPPIAQFKNLSNRQLLKRIDWFGGFLLTLGSLLFLIALNWGGQQYSWSSPRVLTFLLVGISLVIAFGFWEKFGAEYPLYPMRIIQAPRPFFCIIFVIFAAGINYIPLVVFWPIETIAVYGADMKQSGIYNLPIGTCILAGAMLSALLIGLFKPHVTIIMTFFCILQTCGAAALSAIDPHTIASAWAPFCIALIGVGGVLVPNQIIITILTPDDLIASATALTIGIRSQAQVIGLAIYFSRFLHVVQKNALLHFARPIINAGVHDINVIIKFLEGLASHPFNELAQTIPQLAGPNNIAAFNAVKDGALLTFKGAFDYVYLMSIAFGVLACIAAAAMGNIEQYMDEHVAVVLQ
ncbi:hypothetical protein K3495_g7214 [Podosphaera aphanis]|nr:hypothetical protein K3495_g7214 [Podosphaera aphanis]